MEDPKNQTDQIEVTPAMVRAGISELAGYSEDFEDSASLVERVFVAMAAKSPSKT